LLQHANVIAGAAAQTPLPALLAHMDALVSLASGAAAEAEMFGVRAFFLDEKALDTFPGLIARGGASLIQVQSLREVILRLSRNAARHPVGSRPMKNTIREIHRIAVEYSNLCRQPACEEIDGGERVLSEREAPCAA
jgi:hypothetical protein